MIKVLGTNRNWTCAFRQPDWCINHYALRKSTHECFFSLVYMCVLHTTVSSFGRSLGSWMKIFWIIFSFQSFRPLLPPPFRLIHNLLLVFQRCRRRCPGVRTTPSGSACANRTPTACFATKSACRANAVHVSPSRFSAFANNKFIFRVWS